MSANDFESVLDDLDEEFVAGLETALRESPDVVRQCLANHGFVDHYVEHGEAEDEELAEAEQLLLEFMDTVPNPKTTDELVELIQTEQPAVYEEFESAKHRSWINNHLNMLVRAGEIGKYRKGRNVYYTREPLEAVRRWALYNDKFPVELDLGDIDNITNDTGMDRQTVREVVRELSDAV